MDENQMRRRTKAFAVQVIGLTESLPRRRAADIVARQLLRSATSVGANYRAACRAKSKADFICKMNVVLEEADELVSIATASIKTARGSRWLPI